MFLPRVFCGAVGRDRASGTRLGESFTIAARLLTMVDVVWKAGDRTEVGNPGLDIQVAPAFGLARKLEVVRNTWTLTSFGPSDVGVHGNLGMRQNTRSQRAQRAAGVTPLPHSLVSHVFHTSFRIVSYLSRTPGFHPWFQSCCTSRCIPVES